MHTNRQSPRKRRIARYAVALVALATATSTAAACSSSGGSGGGGGSGKPFQFGICCSWGTTWSYNPYTTFYPGFGNDFVYQALALQQPPKLTDFVPELADKWTTAGNKITVHIHDGAKWEDGKPVTGTDVLDTIVLNGTNGGSLSSDITAAAAPDASSVQVTVRPGTPTSQALQDLLGTHVYPASLYGRFVTPDLTKDVFAYYNQYAKDPAAADKSAAKTTMANAFTKLSKFNPTTMLGDGPYKLNSMNTQQAKLLKSSTYFGADKIKIPEVDYVNGQQNEVLYGFLTAQKLDFSNVYLPGPIAQKLKGTPNYHVALPPSFEYAMYFNSSKYPLTMTPVRQALGYVMDRNAMIRAAYGTVSPGGTVEPHPDGLTPAVEQQWLSADEIKSLNTYPHDTSKATSLLQGAGFKKSGGQWTMPNGQPFKLTMEANNATSDIITSFQTAASEFTDFGIKTDVTAVPGAKQSSDLASGSFEITQGFPNSLNPIAEIDAVIGSSNNFIKLGNYKNERGMGFGPVVDVPSQGRINVPVTIHKQATSVAPGPEMKKLAWSWAQLVNRDLPYLQYGNKVYQFSYSTASYTNFPPDSSPIWNLISYNMNGGFIDALQHGYIVPK